MNALRYRYNHWIIVTAAALLGLALALVIGVSNEVLLLVVTLAIIGLSLLFLPPRWYVFLLVALSVYFPVLENIKLPVASSNIHLLDVFMVMALVAWIVRWALQLNSIHFSAQAVALLAIIMAVLVIPLAVGVAQGHQFTSILRDMRVPIYYAILILVVGSSLRTRDDIPALLIGMVVITVPAVVYFYVAWALGIRTTEGAASVVLNTGRYFRYGLITSWEFILLSWLSCVAFLVSGKVRSDRRVWLLLYILVTLLPLLVLLVRALYLGMLGGALVIMGLSHWIRQPQRVLYFVLGAIMFGITLLAVDAASGSGLLSAVTERAASIVDPSASTSGSAANRETRLQAARFIARSTTNPFIGAGYGDRGLFSFSRSVELQALFRHSSYSWLFYRVGLVQGLFLLGIFLVIAARAARRIWPEENGPVRAAALAFLAAFVANLLVGFGNNTVFDFFGPFLIQPVTALIVLLQLDVLLPQPVSHREAAPANGASDPAPGVQSQGVPGVVRAATRRDLT